MPGVSPVPLWRFYVEPGWTEISTGQPFEGTSEQAEAERKRLTDALCALVCVEEITPEPEGGADGSREL